MYNYQGLITKLEENDIRKSSLTHLLHISSRTIAKIGRGEKLSPSVIRKLCEYFSCSPTDLYTLESDNPILKQLREEKDHKISGGLYHELQVRMTYNSNHIEGSKLNEEPNTVHGEESLSVDDIIETINHFRAIDYCIDIAEEPLTEVIIKHLHYLLKSNTKDETLPWFKVGDYKTRPNVVGGRETSKPEQVASDIQSLLAWYTNEEQVSFEDIVEFHFRFERIHPFQDGNGRVGRLIAFKECLKHNLIPFIIEDRKKHFYYRGLTEFLRKPGYLIETCYDGQDTIKRLLEYLEIPH